MVRFLRTAVAVATVCLSSAATVSAVTVTREPLELPPVIEDSSCGYTILVSFPVNRQIITSRWDADGNQLSLLITGRLVVTLTNPDTGESITANISGPSRIDRNGHFVFMGRYGGAGGSGLILFSGRIDTTTGAMHGHVSTDVCELLASGD
jgi:hypothetical protein